MAPLIKTFNSLTSNRRLQGYIVLSVIITFCVTSAIVGAAIWGLNHTEFFERGWLESVADIVASFGAIIVGVIITPALMPLIASFFEDPILNALEKEHQKENLEEYPSGQTPTHDGTFAGDIAEDIRFMFVVIILNVLCLPLYLIPGINLGVYYLLNGYLLGREFFTNVEAKYTSKKQARQIYKANKAKFFGNGIVLAFMATLPIINWFLPVFALTLMFHARRNA